MAHGRKSEKAANMGGRAGKRSGGPGLTKKAPGFGAKLGKMRPGKGPEGPKAGHKY